MLLLPLARVFAGGGPAAVVSAPERSPDWFPEISVSLKEGYDSNVFLSGADQQYMPKGTTTVKNMESWVTTISPRIGFNLAPFIGSGKTFSELTFTYAPDVAIYHDVDSENYTAHRILTVAKGKTGNASYSLENTFAWVDGNTDGPVYPGSNLSAWAVAAARERRAQLQDKMKFSAQYDFGERGKFFIRPVAGLLYYDYHTQLENPELKTTPNGYQNFSDRYDINGGVDFGYKAWEGVALTAGYRYGHQGQEQFSWSKYSAPNDYQRALLGVEGSPAKWLKLTMQFGPDFRSYAPDTAFHTTPVKDHHPVTYYGEANLAAQVTRDDAVAFQFKHFDWISGCGSLPYADTLYELTYKRKLTEHCSLNLGAKAGEADYTMASIAPGMRDDWIVTLSAGLHYSFNPHLSADAWYSWDRGLNGYGDLPVAQQPDSKREFSRHLVSVGLQWKF